MRTFLLFVCALAAVSAQEKSKVERCASMRMSPATGLCKGMTRSASMCTAATQTEIDKAGADRIGEWVRENLCR